MLPQSKLNDMGSPAVAGCYYLDIFHANSMAIFLPSSLLVLLKIRR
jgi:hypothetical protein